MKIKLHMYTEDDNTLPLVLRSILGEVAMHKHAKYFLCPQTKIYFFLYHPFLSNFIKFYECHHTHLKKMLENNVQLEKKCLNFLKG